MSKTNFWITSDKSTAINLDDVSCCDWRLVDSADVEQDPDTYEGTDALEIVLMIFYKAAGSDDHTTLNEENGRALMAYLAE